MTPSVKICGITTPEAVAAAGNADYLGFIFFPSSPRNVTPAQAAALAAHSDIPTVVVAVDPNDVLLESIFNAFTPNYVQLHGNETPERIQQIKKTFNTPIIKAIPIRNAADLASAKTYMTVADILMFDAKAPQGMPGGNGVTFDWKILAGQTFNTPWFLSGGLTPSTVEEALRITHAPMVDVSSGVESSSGVKDPAKVRAFIEKVKNFTS